MSLLCTDVQEGRAPELRNLADTIPDVMLHVFAAPPRDPNRAPPHGGGASVSDLPLRGTTTADPKRDAQAAERKGER
jgi:hypothetical protein